MMAFIREVDEGNRTSFSYLYLANVIGAMLGTLATAAVLIEMLGLHRTSWVAVALNFAVAAVSVKLAGTSPGPCQAAMAEAPVDAGSAERSPLIASILFATGFIFLAMEVVWTRAFTPVLRTTIYSFALLLAVYLLATSCGSLLYRRHLCTRGRTPDLRADRNHVGLRLPAHPIERSAVLSVAPCMITRTLLSIVPFCYASAT